MSVTGAIFPSCEVKEMTQLSLCLFDYIKCATICPYMNVEKKKTLVETVIKSFLGGASICLGTYASKVCPYPILAPLLFSVGILMVMGFNWELITRHVPTSPWGLKTIIVLLGNILVASLLGLMTDLTVSPPDHLFIRSIVGGVVIGLVSMNNLTQSPYKVPVALLLMYIFVMLGLPHCVVYGFLGADFATLLIVILGNLIGGALLKTTFMIVRTADE